jgi:hypothetical protein
MKTLLRAAAVMAFLQFAAHTYLLLSYTPKHGAEEVAVVETMKSHRFDFAGRAHPHSYWELYIGYGLFAALNCLIEAVLFWQLAGMNGAKPIVALFLLANLAYAALVWRFFFFLPPLMADLVIAGCLGAALGSGKRR